MKVFIVASIAAILFVGTVFGQSPTKNKDLDCVQRNIRALNETVTSIAEGIRTCLIANDNLQRYEKDIKHLRESVKNTEALWRPVDVCRGDKCSDPLDKIINKMNSNIAEGRALQAKVKEHYSNNKELNVCIEWRLNRITQKMNKALDCPKKH